MAADPIHVGVVYLETDHLETDIGQDSQGDRFLVSFTGGAPGTKLTELRIRTDKFGDGISLTDPIFDTQPGGLGKNGSHPFQLAPNQTEEVSAEVSDGGQELVLRPLDFQSGDTLSFTIDVDEVLSTVADLDQFNQSLDVILSGQEFQNSILEAVFEAPNYDDASAASIFLNDYGDPNAEFGLNLPPDESDDPNSLPNRSAAAVGSVQQRATPASIGGFVYRDDNDSGTKDPGESGLQGVPIRLEPIDTIEPQSVLTTTTGSDGSYQFNNLMPGRYRVIQVTQPAGLQDGTDSAGTINGQVVGVAVNPGDEINTITLDGGDAGINYNFGELPLGSIGGFVYLAAPGQDCTSDHDADGNVPVVDAEIRLLDSSGNVIETTRTLTDGSYLFDQLPRGVYSIVEVTPEGLIDGGAHVGDLRTLADQLLVAAGQVIDSGTIGGVSLPPGAIGGNYNFCEAAPASISGTVYHDRNDDGTQDIGEEPIEDVLLSLIDSIGNEIATTRTDGEGRYTFAGLAPETYQVVQTQPNGFIDGQDSVGTINDQPVGRLGGDADSLVDIALRQGLHGVEYNFGERQAASISGRVHVDLDEDCELDPGEDTLEGVVIELRDEANNLVATTQTDSEGVYRFDGLAPGTYTVVEQQPEGFFDGGATVGSEGGVAGTNRIANVTLVSGANAENYNFCERPPAEISGTVYVDRDEDCFRDPGEEGLGGVLIELLDLNGNVVDTTFTDSNGNYAFTNLRAGEYLVRETQPDGYFHGGQVAGSHGGDDSQADLISAIAIPWGESLTNYNFCEVLPSEISGVVYVDRDEDCFRDPGEEGLGGVLIELFDDEGRLVDTTQTNSDGAYSFTNLRSGTYTIRETQPDGFFQGGQVAGSGGGDDRVEDVISAILLSSGQSLVNYNFCELLPGSISGKVFSDVNTNSVFDDDESPIAGVPIDLINSSGTVIERTFTDADGCYKFDNLPPDTYQVREAQPDNFFHGGQVVGTIGGRIVAFDNIGEIELRSGDVGLDYNFPELPPATISGYVFQDGDALVISEAPDPLQLREFRDGQLTDDDTRISSVTLELRDITGNLIDASLDQLGNNSGELRVTTDANGFYEFTGLRPTRSYSVYQSQPVDFIDSLDTPGTTGGLAVNLADLGVEGLSTLVRTLSADADPRMDAIFNILVTPGQTSESNNFSEIRIEEPPVVPPEVNSEPILARPATPIETFETPIRQVAFAEVIDVLPPPFVADEWEVSWHLSVINGGFPRGDGLVTPTGVMAMADGRMAAQRASAITRDDDVAVGQLPDVLLQVDLAHGRWQVMLSTGNSLSRSTPGNGSIQMGHQDAIALTGDFDGDGVDEAVLFIAGQWFVDLNGDGKWDAGDLWVRMGTELDRPVVGDWDGDGKDDVGVFGRRWQNDDARIRRDPGLPDPANQRRRNLQREDLVHREPTEQEKQQRVIARGQDGELLADAVDHVFQYGEQVDTPLAGDWNGDGIDQIGVFRSGQWLLDEDGDGRWTNKDRPQIFGRPGDEPIVGDFDGDGIDEIGVVRGDMWIIDTDGDRKLTGNDRQVRVPRENADSQPIVGDFDGDELDDPGYYDAAG